MSKAKDILSGLAGCAVSIVSPTRIGKRNKNGHQSLRLTLDSPEMVLLVLRKRRQLDRNLKVFLEADMTNDQRAEVNALKNELKKRKRIGEGNLVLKYVNGVPKLIPKN